VSCTCVPKGNPSVIGACGCPDHGMKVLRALIVEARGMIPNADERSDKRNGWCARADAALDNVDAS
jgi:hypothetical protein